MNDSFLKKIPIFPLLAVGISFLFFARFIHNFFSYDDFRYIENNFQNLSRLLLGYNTLRVVSNAIWVPLYKLFGFNPTGYNLTNIIFYAGNSILFYYFVLATFKKKNLAFFAGIFFVSSAVGVDAVLWKCAGNSLLSLCFYLSTLLTYVNFRNSGNRRYLFLSIAFYILAMFSKEDAASLPALILLLELTVFSDNRSLKSLLHRIWPYCLIIICYLLLNKLVFSWLALAPSEMAKFYKIRPLYSIAGGFSTFFLAPIGVLRNINPLAYFAALAVPASILLVKDRKLLLFSFCWIIITFLPQSLTSLGQFEPKYIFNSISRYLYIVSIGPALLYASLLINLKERLNHKLFTIIAILIITAFGWINYGNMQERGKQWQEDAEPVAWYLSAIGSVMKEFPPNSFVCVDNPPVGRAYVQQSMRAYYKNPSITWIVDPYNYRPKPGERAFLINVNWGMSGINGIRISEPWSIIPVQ